MFARAWVLVFVLGCADDRSWVPSTVDVAARVQDIGEFSHEQLCKAFDDFVHDPFESAIVVQAACTAHALQTTANAEECAQVADECMSTLPPPVEKQVDRILAQAGCDAASSGSHGCAPVSDLISCLGDAWDEVTKIRLTATCAAFGSTVPEGWWRIPPPDSCVDLARCVP